MSGARAIRVLDSMTVPLRTTPLLSTPLLWRNMLLLAVLASACGDPRGGAVPAFGAPKAGMPVFLDSIRGDSNRQVTGDVVKQASVAATGRAGSHATPPPPPEERSFQGAYRFGPTASEFRPCGSRVSYTIIGRPDAMMRLRDRFRWHAMDPLRPLYAVFYGSVVPDSQSGARDTVGGDAAAGRSSRGRGTEPAGMAAGRQFLLLRPDSLRTWRPGDCGMDQPPRW